MLTWYLARGAGIAAFGALSVATAAGRGSSRRTPSRAAGWCGSTCTARPRCPDSPADRARRAAAGRFVRRVGWPGRRAALRVRLPAGAVTVGLLAMYLIVAVGVTGLLRSRFARSVRAARWWPASTSRPTPAWAPSAWHFLGRRTDAGTGWARRCCWPALRCIAGWACRAGSRPRPPPPGSRPPRSRSRRPPDRLDRSAPMTATMAPPFAADRPARGRLDRPSAAAARAPTRAAR